MQETELIYPKNCRFHSGLLLELFKMADFFLNLNLRNFRFFYFLIISGTAQDILKIQKVLSSWCYKL